MLALDLTLDSAHANIALDEALLDHAESTESHAEILRVWEPRRFIAVLGRSSPIEQEVDLEYCRAHRIEVIRRCSGGATILTGPGCLMYAVLLSYHSRPELRMLEKAHQFVMEQTRQAIARVGIETRMQGTSDLTLNDRKFSGNSLRCKKNWLIYHGTLLCDFDLALIQNSLGDPQRQPEYRRGRSHDQFLTCLPIGVQPLKQALTEQWSVTGPCIDWPQALTRELVQNKYRTQAWNWKVRHREHRKRR